MDSSRRKFIEICVAGTAPCAALAAAPAAITPPTEKKYHRVKLVDAEGRAVRAKSLKAHHNYIFNYPYASTPCFLLNLDREIPKTVNMKTSTGAAYDWPGGVGAAKSIVAYSAICAHKLAYPTSQISFISYRPNPSKASARGQVISCCADKSVYDPFAGAKVMSGPAPQPLAAILLEHDAKTDELFAVGTFGGEKFNEFFQKYDFKLSMEMGDKAREAVTATAKLTDLAAYATQTAQC
jgi:arsenite oxidase small subunit